LKEPIVSDRFVVLSGCSGGGKSTLLAELARRGHSVVEEPGRRIVREEQARGGTALPWVDAEAFIHRAIEMALEDRRLAEVMPGLVFFDRGLFDAISALTDMTGEPALHELGKRHRYHPTVFLTPPWQEIYEADAERKHGLAQAEAEYVRLVRDYRLLDYAVLEVPKLPVIERADWILAQLPPSPPR
jgi:predicted ATPase